MQFVCGSCAKKNNLSLDARLAMSKKIKFGSNVCSSCNKEVIFKIKPIERVKESVQMGLFEVLGLKINQDPKPYNMGS